MILYIQYTKTLQSSHQQHNESMITSHSTVLGPFSEDLRLLKAQNHKDKLQSVMSQAGIDTN